MAQTERDQPAIRTLLADNAEEAISPLDLRDALASQMGYGGMLLTIAGAPQVMSGVDTNYSLVDVFNAIPAKSVDVNTAGTDVTLSPDYALTIGSTGFYYVTFFASFSSSQNNKLATFAPHINDGIGLVEVNRFVSTGADVGSLSMSSVVPYTATDVVDMRVKINAGTTNLTFLAAGISVFRIG